MAQRVEITIHFIKSNKNKIFFCLFFSLLILSKYSFSQQRSPFSDKRVVVGERVFLPYTKGDVIKKINRPQKLVLDKICSIITAWDSIAPPQGMKVFCSGFDNSLEIYFLPFLFEDDTRFASEGGPTLSFYVNTPLQMFGSPIVADIFLCPQKAADFYGFSIYRTDHQEVTIVCKKKLPLFIPVSQEEFLKALIAKEEKNALKGLGPDYQTTFKEMEQAYQKMLKMDKEAAKDFKQQMDEFRAESVKNGGGSNMIDIFTSLKKELFDLTSEERKQQAYYMGSLAIEEYHNVSGLVPYSSKENGEALVKANPELINNSSKDKIQLLIIAWSLGGNSQNIDKPRFYKEGNKGFRIAYNKMAELYRQKKIWEQVFQMVD